MKKVEKTVKVCKLIFQIFESKPFFEEHAEISFGWRLLSVRVYIYYERQKNNKCVHAVLVS